MDDQSQKISLLAQSLKDNLIEEVDLSQTPPLSKINFHLCCFNFFFFGLVAGKRLKCGDIKPILGVLKTENISCKILNLSSK